jgi:hypothetical protein
MANPNLEFLTDAAKLLSPLLQELVFVGGCVTALPIADKAAAMCVLRLMWTQLRKLRPMPNTINFPRDSRSSDFRKTHEKVRRAAAGCLFTYIALPKAERFSKK